MIREGSWGVHSDLDPRWNRSGRAYGDAFSCPDMDAWIAKCKKDYGNPPEDATQFFYKD